MGHLKTLSDHSLSRLRKVTATQFGKISSIIGVKRGVLKDMGVTVANTRKMSDHIAKTTYDLGSLKTKKQILQHFRGKWGLSDTSSKRLLEIITPSEQGRTAEEQKKWEKGNIRYRRLQDANPTMSRLVGKPEDKGKSVKDKLLKARVPESSFARKQTGGQASALTVGTHSAGGIANAHEGAAGVARVSKLEVKPGDMVLEHIEGGTGFAGGKPPKGDTGVIDLDKKRAEKKAAENNKTGARPNLNLAA